MQNQELDVLCAWKQTCPRDAAAIGSGEISEKIMSIGKPSSCSIVLRATSVEKGDIRSCNSESSSKYEGGIKSYRVYLEYNESLLRSVINTTYQQYHELPG